VKQSSLELVGRHPPGAPGETFVRHARDQGLVPFDLVTHPRVLGAVLVQDAAVLLMTH
jgi:hypothetical protein